MTNYLVVQSANHTGHACNHVCFECGWNVKYYTDSRRDPTLTPYGRPSPQPLPVNDVTLSTARIRVEEVNEAVEGTDPSLEWDLTLTDPHGIKHTCRCTEEFAIQLRKTHGIRWAITSTETVTETVQ